MLVAEEAGRSSTLTGRDLLTVNQPTSWDGALRLIAAALPTDGPSIVVLDEFPWFMAREPGLEGTLQVAWDRVFEARPVLMILIGSDVAVMEAITTHGRPLYGRAHEVQVHPFTPRHGLDDAA